MKKGFSRINVPSSVRRKMEEIAREFRKEPMEGERILWEALQREADQARQNILEFLGLAVLRMESEMVKKNLPFALEIIRNAVRNLSQNNNQNTPSPFVGEGVGGGN